MVGEIRLLIGVGVKSHFLLVGMTRSIIMYIFGPLGRVATDSCLDNVCQVASFKNFGQGNNIVRELTNVSPRGTDSNPLIFIPPFALLLSRCMLLLFCHL